MGVEAATFVNDLVTANPPGSDSKSEGDNHLRLLKTVLQATFPLATGARKFSSTDAGATDTLTWTLHRDSASPAANDLLGSYAISGESSTGVERVYARWQARIDDPVNATEDSSWLAKVMVAGVETTVMTLSGSGATFVSVDAGSAFGPSLDLHRDSASPLAGDFIGSLEFTGEDSASNKHTFSAIRGGIDDPTNGAEEGSISFWSSNSGTLVRVLNLSDGVSSSSTGGLINPGAAEYGFSTSIDNLGETTIACTGSAPFRVKRGEDGTLLNWYSGTTNVASISVASGVVTYGTFFGSHMAQTLDDMDKFLRGTILESTGKLSNFKKMYHNALPMVKVSDRSGGVPYGVFACMSDDGFDNVVVGGLGAFVIRIDPDENAEKDDLIESAGNGCGRVMRDNSLSAIEVLKRRVATVTSAEKIDVFEDGSYTVPCTLHCG